MIEMNIDWGSDCFNCGHREAIIYSTSSLTGTFHDGDEVKCCNCGHKGEMDARGEDSDITWDEGLSQDLPESLKQILKEVS